MFAIYKEKQAMEWIEGTYKCGVAEDHHNKRVAIRGGERRKNEVDGSNLVWLFAITW
jgi:hypothetical protein